MTLSIKKIYMGLFLLLGLIILFGCLSSQKFHIAYDAYMTANYSELLSAAQSLPTTGFLTADFRMIKVSDDYINKLYPILLSSLREEEKKCLRPSSAEKGGHISLWGDPITKVFPGQNYNFSANGILREVRIKKYSIYSVKETWYEVNIHSADITENFKETIYPMHISIGVSKKIIGTLFCG